MAAAGVPAAHMSTGLRVALACVLLFATVRAAEPPVSPHGEAREEADEAAQRNEARERPERTGQDRDEDQDKGATRTQAADRQAAGNPPGAPENSAGTGDEGDAQQPGGRLTLTAAQQEAVGIRVERAQHLSSAAAVDGYATVLDPVALVTDAGRIESTRAAAAAAAADAARQQTLYRDGERASLKAVQGAEAQAAESNAQAQAALLSFRQQWGPLASWSTAQRAALIDALGSGRSLVLRADVPGRHLGTQLSPDALLEVDGAHVAARVLGALPRTDVATQSSGWLLLVERAPAGLGAGARTAVHLKSGVQSGLLVPAAALVYAEEGACVYRRIAGQQKDTFSYESVKVHPLVRVGAGWVIDGLGPGDQVVVQGVGVLWSLEGIASFSAAEEDHD